MITTFCRCYGYVDGAVNDDSSSCVLKFVNKMMSNDDDDDDDDDDRLIKMLFCNVR